MWIKQSLISIINICYNYNFNDNPSPLSFCWTDLYIVMFVIFFLLLITIFIYFSQLICSYFYPCSAATPEFPHSIKAYLYLIFFHSSSSSSCWMCGDLCANPFLYPRGAFLFLPPPKKKNNPWDALMTTVGVTTISGWLSDKWD